MSHFDDLRTEAELLKTFGFSIDSWQKATKDVAVLNKNPNWVKAVIETEKKWRDVYYSHGSLKVEFQRLFGMNTATWAFADMKKHLSLVCLALRGIRPTSIQKALMATKHIVQLAA